MPDVTCRVLRPLRIDAKLPVIPPLDDDGRQNTVRLPEATAYDLTLSGAVEILNQAQLEVNDPISPLPEATKPNQDVVSNAEEEIADSNDGVGDTAELINVNSTDEADLKAKLVALPKVGRVTANRIYMAQPFQSLDEVKEAANLSDEDWAIVKEYLTV